MSLKPKSTVSDKEHSEVVAHKPNDTKTYYNRGNADATGGMIPDSSILGNL